MHTRCCTLIRRTDMTDIQILTVCTDLKIHTYNQCEHFFLESQNKHQNRWCREVDMWYIMMFTSTGPQRNRASLTESKLFKTTLAMWQPDRDEKAARLKSRAKVEKIAALAGPCIAFSSLTCISYHKYWSLAHLITNTCRLIGLHLEFSKCEACKHSREIRESVYAIWTKLMKYIMRHDHLWVINSLTSQTALYTNQ